MKILIKNIRTKNFQIKTELNGSLFLLGVKIFRENEKFATCVFSKDAFFIPIEYRFGLVHNFLNHCFNLLNF